MKPKEKGEIEWKQRSHQTIKESKLWTIKKIINISDIQISKTSEEINNYNKQSSGIMNGILSELAGMLFSLGFDDNQEKTLMQLADKATEQLVGLMLF